MMKNQFIQNHLAEIDFTFWDYHIGDADIEHRRIVRQAINRMVGLNPVDVENLTNGYKLGKSTWDEFWINNYKDTGYNNFVNNEEDDETEQLQSEA